MTGADAREIKHYQAVSALKRLDREISKLRQVVLDIDSMPQTVEVQEEAKEANTPPSLAQFLGSLSADIHARADEVDSLSMKLRELLF